MGFMNKPIILMGSLVIRARSVAIVEGTGQLLEFP